MQKNQQTRGTIVTQKNRSLIVEITIVITLIVVFVSFASFIINMTILSKESARQFTNKRNEYVSFLKESLEIPLWNYDTVAAAKIGKIIISNNIVSSLQINAKNGNLLYAERKGYTDDIKIIEKIIVHNHFIGSFELGLTKRFYYDQRKQITITFFISIFAVIVSILFFVSLTVRRLIKKPLSDVTERINSIADGNYQAVDGATRYCELIPILEQFNQMAAQVEEREHSLALTNQTLNDEIEERIKTERLFDESQIRYKTLSENVPVGVFRSAVNGEIESCNPAFYQMLGLDETIDKSQLFAGDFYVRQEDRQEFLNLISQDGQVKGFECQFKKGNGDLIWVSMSARGLINESGSHQYLDGIIEDITERKFANAALKKSEEKYRRLVENIGDRFCLFRHTIEGIITYVSPNIDELIGIPQEDVLGRNWRSLLEWDLEAVQKGEKMQAQLLQSIIQYGSMELSFTDTNDEARILEITNHALYDDSGVATGLQGILVDITKHKQIEEKLKHYHDELEATVRKRTEQLSKTVKVLERSDFESKTISKFGDLLQTCETDNESYQIITSLCNHIFSGYSGFVGVYNDNLSKVSAVALFGDFARRVIEFNSGDCWALRRGGTHLVNNPDVDPFCPHADKELSSLCVPVRAKGEFIGLLHLAWNRESEQIENSESEIEAVTGLAKRVAELYALSLSNIRLRARLREQSILDPLTKLYNRRYMEEALHREITRCKRKETSVGILLFDVDHFKSFNDNHGHDAGDAVLIRLGSFLNDLIRGEDVACRYGGEEILIIMPDCTPEILRKRAEDLRAGIEMLTVNHRNNDLKITISVGIALYPKHGKDANTVIFAADTALYTAKKEGRNRVVAA